MGPRLLHPASPQGRAGGSSATWKHSPKSLQGDGPLLQAPGVDSSCSRLSEGVKEVPPSHLIAEIRQGKAEGRTTAATGLEKDEKQKRKPTSPTVSGSHQTPCEGFSPGGNGGEYGRNWVGINQTGLPGGLDRKLCVQSDTGEVTAEPLTQKECSPACHTRRSWRWQHPSAAAPGPPGPQLYQVPGALLLGPGEGRSELRDGRERSRCCAAQWQPVPALPRLSQKQRGAWAGGLQVCMLLSQRAHGTPHTRQRGWRPGTGQHALPHYTLGFQSSLCHVTTYLCARGPPVSVSPSRQ